MKVEREMSGARMGQRMRLELATTATSARGGRRLIGVGWVMGGFLEDEVQGMEGVE